MIENGQMCSPCPELGSSKVGKRKMARPSTGLSSNTSLYLQTWSQRYGGLCVLGNHTSIVESCQLLIDPQGYFARSSCAPIFCYLVTLSLALFSQKAESETLELTPYWEDGRGKYTGTSIFIPGGASNVGQFGQYYNSRPINQGFISPT